MPVGYLLSSLLEESTNVQGQIFKCLLGSVGIYCVKRSVGRDIYLFVSKLSVVSILFKRIHA